MAEYHDREWGVPSHDDMHLFEMLTLEGAQAGLSWAVVLAKRPRYRELYMGFDPAVVAAFGPDRQEVLLADPGIVRHRSKVAASVTNAAAFIEVQRGFGSFASYLWGWVDGRPVVNHPAVAAEVAPRSALAERLSADLKKRGFRFVGPTIVQSFLQAVGVIDDHLRGCPAKRRSEG